MGIKKWTVREPDPQAVQAIVRQTNLRGLGAKLAASKGLGTAASLRAFFEGEGLSDPYLLADMHAAVDCIRAAVEEGTRIAVYGDYDCDGVTATAMLVSYLQYCGADVLPYIPDRADEGYGLNEAAVRSLHEQEVGLIVTVDNGVSAHAEAEVAAQLGMQLVITDHHQPPETLPRAAAVVNPHRADCPSPFKQLAGAGVALKLICALEEGDWDTVLEQYGDLAAIGTIGDVVSLRGENRTLVQIGLRMLALTENPGLLALMEASHISPDELDSTRVAFGLVPRINAAGRFGSATQALDLLMCESTEQAERLAQTLCALNTARREAEGAIIADIEQRIQAHPKLLDSRLLILWGEGWHQGVIGIVAARLVERFGKPVVLLSVNGDVAHGSARSVPGFSLYDALTACKEHLLRYGGHTGAAGMTVAVESLGSLRAALLDYAKERYPVMPLAVQEADMAVTAADITVEDIQALEVFEPFGESNPQPVFALLGATLGNIYPVKDGRYVRLQLDCGGKVYAICFDRSFDSVLYPRGTTLDLLVTLELGEYNGTVSPSVRLLDMRLSGLEQDKYFAAKAVYEQLRRGEAYDVRLRGRIIPDRNDGVAVFKLLRSHPVIPIDTLYELLHAGKNAKNGENGMNYCKLRLILDIFAELGLVSVDAAAQTASLLPEVPGVKSDFESSVLLKALKSTR